MYVKHALQHAVQCPRPICTALMYPAKFYADSHVSQTKMAEVIISPPDSPAERVRDVTQYLYPDLLLLAFIAIGATHSVYTAMRKEDVVVPTVTGPGGKPLPVTKRRKSEDDATEPDEFSPNARRFFQSSMILATLTFLATGGAIAARALIHRSADGQHGWWCGEPKTVSKLECPYLIEKKECSQLILRLFLQLFRSLFLDRLSFTST